MNGIYIDTEKLTERPDCVTWLDRCGAKWSSGVLFSDGENPRKYIVFNGFYSNKFSTSDSSSDSYTHIPDPEQFCREVAKRLGIEEPKFDHLPEVGKVIYPHKTYRVLDSLDGIPLDTRIPLSEWIPPFWAQLIFIDKTDFAKGVLSAIKSEHAIVQSKNGDMVVSLKDGHWMRIV